MALLRSNRTTFIGNQSMEWVEAGLLRIAPWRSTYILKPDLEVLARSLADYGWLSALVVQRSSNMIIDGNYRWEVSSNLDKLRQVTGGKVPVIYVDCDDIEAMMLHARLNRARGEIVAKRLSRLIQQILRSRKYGEADVKRAFAMHADEVDVMVDGTLVKDKNISEHKYSPAWVPIEAPATAKEQAMIIERPPNRDG